VFQGLHHNLLDEKGRVAFPAPLRAALAEQGAGESFVLTQSFYEPCLVALTEERFRGQADRVRELPPSNPAVMEFKRVVIASATTLSIDKAGRVNVPKELRDYAGLDREVVWAGVIDTIELWSKQRWDERNARRLQDKDALEAYRQVLEEHGL
jgi:MraZ protein